MPTYSYKCPTCGHAFDIQQAFTDDSLTDCPNCGGALRKVFSAVGVTFNGSGFYRTDSRPGGAGGPAKDAGSGSSAPAATPASAPAPAAASSSSTSTSSTPAKSTTSAS